MTERKFRLHDGASGAAITVRVTPRSSKNEISEILDDGTIKVRLTAPPVEGKANQALIDFLAGVLDVAPGQIEIVAGLSGKDKLITVINMDSNTVHAKILNSLA
jgi:uncharacterized protein